MAPRKETIRVRGLKELLYAIDQADRKVKKYVRDEIRSVAVPVLAQARLDLVRLDPPAFKTADGLRIYVRKAGTVSVEQRLRKTGGLRADWGKTQMTQALIPSLNSNQAAIRDSMDRAISRIADRLNGGI